MIMAEIKGIRINRQELILGLLIFLFILALSALSIMFPLVAPILGVMFGVVLVVSGTYAYRHSTDAAIRAIAIAVIAGGIMVILIAILILASKEAYTIMTSSIENYPGSE